VHSNRGELKRVSFDGLIVMNLGIIIYVLLLLLLYTQACMQLAGRSGELQSSWAKYSQVI